MKIEFPPLLTPGFHNMALPQLRELCVDAFDSSPTRPDIFTGIEKVIEELMSESISGEMWVDGSFLTEKPDPEDSDVLLCVSGAEYDLMDGAKRAKIDWFEETDLKPSHKCDSYVHREYPEGHLWHPETIWMRAYWIKQFGFSRTEAMKGMALVAL